MPRRWRRVIDLYDYFLSIDGRRNRWIDIGEIEKELDLNPRAVRRTLDYLNRAGVIELERGKAGGGGHRTQARLIAKGKRPLL